MSATESARQPLHITLRWAGRADLALPEVMINAYGTDAAELEVLLAEAAAAVSPFIAAVARADGAAAPAPQVRTERPVVSRIPATEIPREDPLAGICPNPECSLEGVPMMTSNYGGLFCPGADDSEADGRCRWVHDDKGLRRKPTRAEIDAGRAISRASGRGRR